MSVKWGWNLWVGKMCGWVHGGYIGGNGILGWVKCVGDLRVRMGGEGVVGAMGWVEHVGG